MFAKQFSNFFLSVIQIHQFLRCVMKTNVFHSTFCWIWASNVWIWFISHLFSIIDDKLCLYQEILHYYHHEMILLLILLMIKVLLSFLLKLNFHHPCKFTSPLQKAVKQNHHTLHNCYSVKNMLKLLVYIQMALKPVAPWNKMLRSHVNLVICLVKFMISIFTLSFLISLFRRFPFWFQTLLEKLSIPFPFTNIMMVLNYGNTFLYFFRFFP